MDFGFMSFSRNHSVTHRKNTIGSLGEFQIVCRQRESGAEIFQRIDRFESELDSSSVLTLKLRSPVQALLAGWGVGNEDSYIGRNGWLRFT